MSSITREQVSNIGFRAEFHEEHGYCPCNELRLRNQDGTWNEEAGEWCEDIHQSHETVAQFMSRQNQ